MSELADRLVEVARNATVRLDDPKDLIPHVVAAVLQELCLAYDEELWSVESGDAPCLCDIGAEIEGGRE